MVGAWAKARTRRPSTWFVLRGVAAVVLFVVLAALQSVGYGMAPYVSMLLAAGLCAISVAVTWWPRSATVLFCLSAAALPLMAAPDRDPAWPWPWSVPALVAFVVFVVTITVGRGWRAGLVPWAVSNLAVWTIAVAVPHQTSTGAVTANLIVAAAVSAVALLVGALVAERIRVGGELARERELAAVEHSRRALVDERTRIARELHDVVAHGMSVIQVQASTARYRIPDLDAAAIAEFETIADSARGSLVEMRRLLGVLRTDDRPRMREPQQGIDDIPALVENLRHVGTDIALTLTVERELAPGVQVTIFRIVQEALSNAVRHAPGATIDVEVGVGDDAVRIRIRDGGNGIADEPTDDGHGLRGMRERVALLDGSLTAGPDPEGGWVIAAELPLTEPDEEHS